MDGEPELPIATVRPRRRGARAAAAIAAGPHRLARWARGRVRGLGPQPTAFLLTGIVFSGMMLAMGYVADRAARAGEAIDAMHREQLERVARERMEADLRACPIVTAATGADPWGAAGALRIAPPAGDDGADAEVGPAALFRVLGPR